MIRARNPSEDADALNLRRQVEGHRRRGHAGIHLRLVERPDAHVLERVPGEHVGCEVQPVGPHAELGIVGKEVGRLQRVEVPPAVDRISRPRDGETLEVGRDRVARVRRERKVGDDPAIGTGVPHHDGIAEILIVARVAQVSLAHQRVEAERGDLDAVALAKDADGGVDGLNVVDRSDVAVRVGRPTVAPMREVESGEIAGAAPGARSRRRRRRSRGLRRGIAAATRQGRLLALVLDGTMLALRRQAVRQLAKIAVERSSLLQSNDPRRRSRRRRRLSSWRRASERDRREHRNSRESSRSESPARSSQETHHELT